MGRGTPWVSASSSCTHNATLTTQLDTRTPPNANTSTAPLTISQVFSLIPSHHLLTIPEKALEEINLRVGEVVGIFMLSNGSLIYICIMLQI